MTKVPKLIWPPVSCDIVCVGTIALEPWELRPKK